MTNLRWNLSVPRSTRGLLVALLVAMTGAGSVGCGDDDMPVVDGGGIRDSGPGPDAGGHDSGPDDAGADDAGADDAGADDAGADDAGAIDDAGADDAGEPPDAGEMPDAGIDGGDTRPIPAPRPIEPASTARSTSLLVRFRWALTAPATGARLEICRDPACVDVRETQDVVGDTVTALVPPDPLPSSRVFYWRLTGRDGARLGTEQSPIWSVSVHGGATGTVSSTWGSTYDLDQDGLAEVLAGAPESSTVRLWRGRAPLGAAPPTPSTVISAASPLRLGTAIANGGDLNGDGIGDLVVGGADAAYAYHGVPGGLPASLGSVGASTTLAGLGTLTAASIAVAGDVDRDGYADLVVGQAAMNRVVVHRGSATGLEATGTPIARSEPGFGRSVAGGCDVNADGFADVIVGADGAAIVLLGAETGFGTSATVLTPGPTSAGFGASVACAGDVNGDGYPDVIVGAPVDHAAFVYQGGAAGIGVTASAALRKAPGDPGGGVTTFHGDSFGSMVAAAGDVNGDEYGDVVVVAPDVVAGTTGFFGYAFVFHGSSGGLPVTPPTASTVHQRAFGSTPIENRITASRLVGDANGDGIDDVVSGAAFRAGGTGAMLLHAGVQGTGVPATQVWLIEGGVLTGLGTTVAWLWDGVRAGWARGT